MRKALGLFGLLALSACDDPRVTEAWYHGSQIAVETCIKQNTSSLLDDAVVRSKCIEKNEHPAPDGGVVTGTLGIRTTYGLVLSPTIQNTAVTFQNKPINEIITGLQLAVTITKPDRSSLVIRGRMRNLWICPSAYSEGMVERASDDEMWAQAKELIDNGAKWTWEITSVKSITLTLR